MSDTSLTGPQKGRVAFVTGASRGIGRASALGLAKAGAHVIACARSQGALEELDDEIFQLTGEHATLIPFDMADGAALTRLSNALAQRFSQIDVFVHAAATLGTLSPVAHYEAKDFSRIIALNLGASHRLIGSMEPMMKLSSAARAIFFTSGVAAHPRAFWGPYAASKAGLEALVRCWADEVEFTSIRAAIINPGPMRTRMRAEAFPGEDPETLPPPEAIVPLILQLADPQKEPTLETIQFREWANITA